MGLLNNLPLMIAIIVGILTGVSFYIGYIVGSLSVLDELQEFINKLKRNSQEKN